MTVKNLGIKLGILKGFPKLVVEAGRGALLGSEGAQQASDIYPRRRGRRNVLMLARVEAFPRKLLFCWPSS